MMRPFRSYAERHGQNLASSRTTTAKAAIFEQPDGTEEPAVAVFRGMHYLAFLTIEDATRLSNELIDAIERAAI